MRKFYLSLMTAALLCACAKVDGPDAGEEIQQKEIADYTVIFWGMCGTNDAGVANDLATLASLYVSGDIGDNVDIAGLLKTSVNLTDPDAADFDKTYYFESSDNMTGKTFDGTNINTIEDLYDRAFKVLDGKPYADVSYPLSNTDSLAAFISRVAEEHPARNYTLMLLGHGGGFSPAEETAQTKACLYDNYRDGAYLTADAVVSAVQKSGVKIQTIFTQCCLMATLENIAAYSQVFDYGILSAEVTYSEYFPMYLKALSKAGDDLNLMKTNSKWLIDYYVSTLEGYPDAYSSHGFYDLGQAPQLLSVVKDIASWYSTNYPKLQDEIDEALSSCIFCDNLPADQDSLFRKERALFQDILAGKDVSGSFDIGGYDVSTPENLFISLIYMMSDLTEHAISYGFPLSHVLDCTLDCLSYTKHSSEKSSLQSLATQYTRTLKNMAYIRASVTPSGAGSSYPYMYTSPTINIFALNEQYFRPLFGSNPNETLNALVEAFRNDDEETAANLMEELFGGSPFAREVSLEQATANYTSSVFDRQVNWSQFLKQLQMNPSVIYNPDRSQINEKF